MSDSSKLQSSNSKAETPETSPSGLNGGEGGGKPKKRSQACVSCRRQKMKCQFSTQSEPPCCDRCRIANIECRFEVRANDKQWTSAVEDRLHRLENALAELMDVLQNNNMWNTTSLTASAALKGNGTPGPKNPEHARQFADATSSMLSVLQGSRVSGSRGSYSGDESPSSDMSGGRAVKRARISEFSEGGFDYQLLDPSNTQILVEFFNTKLVKYLPILVFKYLPQFDLTIQQRCNVLFLSILSVASLYHDEFQDRHAEYRAKFVEAADALDYNRIVAGGETSPRDVDEVIDIIVALCLAGAWLGGEMGFRMSTIATNLAGTVLPDEQNKLSASDHFQREKFGAVGLMTYIIEQRLRIIHARPVDPTQLVNNKRRDFFLAQFLASMMPQRGGFLNMDSAELKITANVELCAIILMLQLDLQREIHADVVVHWNNQLDKWLSEWMGRLAVTLLPSTWKPVLLTFHFAKLFLNSEAGGLGLTSRPGSTESYRMEPDLRMIYTKVAERSATDILDMLVRDRDTERLIGVGPVFYPTIFITAGALIVRLLSMVAMGQYSLDQERALKSLRSAYSILTARITSGVFPCYSSIQNLGTGITKVQEMQSQTFDPQFGKASPIAPIDATRPSGQAPPQVPGQAPMPGPATTLPIAPSNVPPSLPPINARPPYNSVLSEPSGYVSLKATGAPPPQPPLGQPLPQRPSEGPRYPSSLPTNSNASYPSVDPKGRPDFEEASGANRLWSFTPFRNSYEYDPNLEPIVNNGSDNSQDIWQPTLDASEFLMDAHSSKLLDALGLPRGSQ